ncbi:MAG: hormogonium polysaccharide biosynthesis glycosyltransferase HpsE [Cyanobacteria bacterium P01_E01_bin.6]
MSQDVFFTAAIRTYNAENHIATILDRLKTQEQVQSMRWEILVVDNNSTDNTLDIVSHYQANWPASIPLRCVKETKQGASYARRRAIQEAHGQWIGFLDDDTWPTATWVAAIGTFAQNHPRAGAFNGNIHGRFEGTPPKGFKKIAPFFAVIERGTQTAYCINEQAKAHKVVMPPGAGLVVRRQAWLESVPASLVLKGPIGSTLSAKGEDMEALMYLSRQHWEVWFNPEQNIEHYIPQSRFELNYLLRFFRGIGLGKYRTRILAYQSWYGFLMLPFYFANDLRKFIVFWLRHRQELRQDVVLAGQMQMLLYTLVSPFYLASNMLKGS